MKIAMMTNNYKPFIGGVPISVERLAEGLKDLGHEVVVFAPTYKKEQWKDEEAMQEKDVVRYHSLVKGIAGGVVVPNPLDPRIEQEFRKGQFDIIHVHHPMAIGNTAIYLSKKYKVPLVFTYHTRYEQYLHYLKPIMWLEKGSEKNGLFHKLQKNTLTMIKENLVPGYLKTFLKHCHHVFAPTVGMEAYLTEICDISKEKVSVLPTGLKTESFCTKRQNMETLRKKYDAVDCPLFISVSRLAHEKNIPFLLQSLAFYKLMYKKPFRILLVGEGPDREEYEDLVRTLHLEKEVIFTGLLPNEVLPDYYRAADLFLFASKTETQGIVILEAMAAKTPVIALRATGVSDIVSFGENGFCCKEEVSIFSEYVHHTIQDKKLLKQLKEGAFMTASSYRQEEIARKAETIYQVVIEKNQECAILYRNCMVVQEE